MTIPAHADTLVCDTARIATWQADPATNYNRELLTPEVNVLEWISMQVARLLQKLFGSEFAEEYTELILIGLVVVLLLLVVWFLYRKRPELFMRLRRNRLDYQIQEDTIYGVDFEQEIATALQQEDYRSAIRLLYLQTLKQLSDAERIDWQPYKTPTEYLYEVKAEGIRASFRLLTTGFLRVRYGNFDASEPLFREMQHWQAEIKKGGTP